MKAENKPDLSQKSQEVDSSLHLIGEAEAERQKSLTPGKLVVWRTESDKQQFIRPAHGFSQGPFEIVRVVENSVGKMPGMEEPEKALVLKDVASGKVYPNEISAYYLQLQKRLFV